MISMTLVFNKTYPAGTTYSGPAHLMQLRFDVPNLSVIPGYDSFEQWLAEGAIKLAVETKGGVILRITMYREPGLNGFTWTYWPDAYFYIPGVSGIQAQLAPVIIAAIISLITTIVIVAGVIIGLYLVKDIIYGPSGSFPWLAIAIAVGIVAISIGYLTRGFKGGFKEIKFPKIFPKKRKG